MAAKGIPTRPAAKRLNKKPLILFLTLFIIIIMACFYVVNDRQNRLKNPVATGQVIETPPINNNTPTPEFFQEGFLNELDRQDELAKTLKSKAQEPNLEVAQVPQIEESVQIKEQIQPSINPLEEKRIPQPFYQEAPPLVVQPEKSPAELHREKVAQQRRDAALQAQRAPTAISIGAATASNIPQMGNQPGMLQNSQYPQAQMTIPETEKLDQTLKQDFLNSAAENKVVLADAYRPAISPFELKQGHLIPMMLITKINSDLPGRIKAQVTENVYDTATGNFLLIPQGTMVNGIYDSRVVFGQKRVLIAWQRLIFPDGSSLNVGSMPGSDQEGTSGLKDQVDNHYFQIFGAAILMSVVNAGFSMATETDTDANDTETVQDTLAKSAAQQMQQTFARLIDKIMSIQPELVIRQGKQGHILLTKDILGLKPYNPAQKPTYYINTVQAN